MATKANTIGLHINGYHQVNFTDAEVVEAESRSQELLFLTVIQFDLDLMLHNNPYD